MGPVWGCTFLYWDRLDGYLRTVLMGTVGGRPKSQTLGGGAPHLVQMEAAIAENDSQSPLSSANSGIAILPRGPMPSSSFLFLSSVISCALERGDVGRVGLGGDVVDVE